MTRKYESECWSCKSKDLEVLKNHVKCRSCGATWNYLGAPGQSPVIEVDVALKYRHPGAARQQFSPRGANKRESKAPEN